MKRWATETFLLHNLIYQEEKVQIKHQKEISQHAQPAEHGPVPFRLPLTLFEAQVSHLDIKSHSISIPGQQEH